jgi:hypothetical protein
MRRSQREGLTAVIMQLPKRGPRAYEGFLNSLTVTGHFDAVTVLEPERDARELAQTAHDLR